MASPEKCNTLWAVWEQPVLVFACAYASCELNPVQEVTSHHSGLQGKENVCTLPICKPIHAYMYYTNFVMFLFGGHQSPLASAFIIGSASIGGCPPGEMAFVEWGRCLFWVCRWLGTFLQHLRSFSCKKKYFYMLGKTCALFVHC